MDCQKGDISDSTMSMDEPTSQTVAFVVPAINEQATIGGVVMALRPHGQVVVVNDGSHDETATKAKEAGALVVSKVMRQGYDRALISGFQHVIAERLADWVVTVDADGQHAMTSVAEVLQTIATGGSDLILGVRPKFPRVSEQIIALFYKAKWGVPDPLCGLKAYRTEHLARIKFAVLDNIDTIGTGAMLGLLAQNARTAIQQIETLDRRDLPRFGTALSANFRILKLLANTPKVWKAVSKS